MRWDAIGLEKRSWGWIRWKKRREKEKSKREDKAKGCLALPFALSLSCLVFILWLSWCSLVLCCDTLGCLVLSRLVLSRFVLSCLFLSCPLSFVFVSMPLPCPWLPCGHSSTYEIIHNISKGSFHSQRWKWTWARGFSLMWSCVVLPRLVLLCAGVT